MDDQDCRKLMKNLTTLKERLGKQSHDFDSIIDILIEKGVFIFNKKDEIYAGKTESQKMDIFLKSLMASGPRAYGQFRDALLSFKDSRYEDVVSALDRTELTFVRGLLTRTTIKSRMNSEIWPDSTTDCRVICKNSYTRIKGKSCEDTFGRPLGLQQGAIPKREVTLLGTSRSMSVMTNQMDPIADLASKLDQVLESQNKMRDQIREDVQTEFKNMNSKIESIKHTQANKERAKYNNDLVKLEAEKTELMEKSDTLQKHYTSVKEQLREKNETVNNLIKENKSLKSKLNQTDKRQLLTQNKNKIKLLQDEMKILKDEKEKIEKENTVLRRTNSFYNLPHPRASLPKIENPPIVKTCTTYQYLYRNKNAGNKS